MVEEICRVRESTATVSVCGQGRMCAFFVNAFFRTHPG